MQVVSIQNRHPFTNRVLVDNFRLRRAISMTMPPNDSSRDSTSIRHVFGDRSMCFVCGEAKMCDFRSKSDSSFITGT